MGILYWLATWNAREIDDANEEKKDFGKGFWSIYFGGIYTDFNSYWFKDVGAFLIQAMLFNSAWPLIEFSLYGTL
jgi:hypothetical protein